MSNFARRKEFQPYRSKPFLHMNETTVSLDRLSIGYRTRQGTVTVADGLTAGIMSNRLTCLLGRNGVGKSTLLRTLAGFQPALGGTISIAGRQISDYSDRMLARTVGIVLTERLDVQQMTVGELVALGRSPYTGFWGTLDSDDKRVVAQAISDVGITPLTDRMVSTLSDGERQKTMIAKALAQQTPVVLLDEPTAFLDYPSKVEMLLLLRRISRQQQKTVFLSTHDVELALQVADTVWLMDKGSTPLLTGTPQQLAADGQLTQFIEHSGNVVFNTETLSVKVKK